MNTQKLYVVPEVALKESISTYVKDADEYQLQLLDYPRYAKNNMDNQCKRLGMKTYDIAIPIDFARECVKLTGQNPVGHVVMNYDNNLCGNPIGITREGKILMEIYEHIKRLEYMKV